MRHVLRNLRVLAPFVALAMLIVGLQAHAMYRCGIDGQARSACCCPDDKADKDVDKAPQTAIDPADCCGIEAARLIATGDVRVESDRSSTEMTTVATVHDVLAAAVVPESRQRSSTFRHAHRSSGPPLRLVKQSFLL